VYKKRYSNVLVFSAPPDDRGVGKLLVIKLYIVLSIYLEMRVPYLMLDTLDLHLGQNNDTCCLVTKKILITHTAVKLNTIAAFQVSISHETMNSSKKKRVTANATNLITNSR
jgi:hypothetical protein